MDNWVWESFGHSCVSVVAYIFAAYIPGDGTVTTPRSTAVDVVGLSFGVTIASLGQFHSCAVQLGAVYCFGFNGRGGLGGFNSTHVLFPGEV